jgi:hypothetical protein
MKHVEATKKNPPAPRALQTNNQAFTGFSVPTNSESGAQTTTQESTSIASNNISAASSTNNSKKPPVV